MCVVSNVTDYGRYTWPNPWDWEPKVYPDIKSPIVDAKIVEIKVYPTAEEIDSFLALIHAAEQFDDKTGQADCIDPEKKKWLDAIKRYRAKLGERKKMQTYTVILPAAQPTWPLRSREVMAETWEVHSNGTLVLYSDKSSKSAAAIYPPGQWIEVLGNGTKGTQEFLQEAV